MRNIVVQRSWIAVMLALVAGAARAAGTASLADAVEQRDKTAVAALLKQRADVNAPQADGTTALHWAVRWKDIETANQLLKAGATADQANRYEATPLWMA